MTTPLRMGLAALSGVAMLSTGGYAMAAQTDGTPAPSTSSSTATAPAHKGALLDPAQREQLRHDGHVAVSLLVQRGKLVAVSRDAIVVRSKDGYRHSYKIDADTKIVQNGQPINVTDLSVGDPVGVLAERRAGADVALRVRAPEKKATSGTTAPSTPPTATPTTGA